ncbi:MAG TPA: PDZ domain-containing protein, partial [Myxococcales bacterium]|nr:PDZ domain-containing protein [Myxococcales bacterium]
TGGLKIDEVDGAGPAAKAGLRKGDLIVQVDGDAASSLGVEGLTDAVRRSEGRKVSLSVRRNGETGDLAVDVFPERMVRKCPDEAGLRQDFEEAFRWYQKSADGGNLTALFFLAQAHRNGQGTPRDPAKAIELFERGAARGDWQAAHEIFMMYAAGEGVEKNEALAEKWARKSIQLKHESLGR